MTDSVLVLLDGLRRVDVSTPVIRADDLGFLRGESVFETARIARGRACFLRAHLARLEHSADRIEIAFPVGLIDLCAKAVAEWDQPDGVLRIVLTKGGVTFALVTDVPAKTVLGRDEGVTAMTLTLGVTAEERERAPWLLGGVKSTSYAVNMASLRHAQDLGVDDVVWVSSDGEVLEAPTSTVVAVLGGVLVTPPPSVGILPGTTLQALLDLGAAPAEVRRMTVQELAGADEVAMLSSVRGVAPVTSLDGRLLGIGPVTTRLRAAFEASL